MQESESGAEVPTRTSDAPPRVIVLGAAGMMGHTLLRSLGREFDVLGTIRTDSHASLDRMLPAGRSIATSVDVLDRQVLDALFADFAPDVVVNCVGIVKQLKEANDAIISIKTNSLLPHQLAETCTSHDARLIHISTDCVFSGRRGNYTENDLPDPTDLYGRSKLLGETTGPGALTLRTSIIGRQLRGHGSLLDWFLSNRGGEVRGFTKAIYSGLTTRALAEIIEQILLRDVSPQGLWQVASEPISKYELLCKLNEALQTGVQVTTETDFECDRSLDGSAFVSEFGIATPSWPEMIARLADDQAAYDFLGL